MIDKFLSIQFEYVLYLLVKVWCGVSTIVYFMRSEITFQVKSSCCLYTKALCLDQYCSSRESAIPEGVGLQPEACPELMVISS